MKNFKSKAFSGKQSIGQMIKEGAIKGASNPFAWLGAIGTGVSVANYRTNKLNKEQSAIQHAEVTKQNERLIKALSGVERGLQSTKSIPIQVSGPSPKKDNSWLSIRGKKVFSEKKYSIKVDTAQGAALGGAIGTALASGYLTKATKKSKMMTPLIGAALGAIVGATWGSVKKLDSLASRVKSGHSLIKKVQSELGRSGLKEGTDWVTNPKQATLLKTRVCIVINRGADELGLLINTVSEPGLWKVTKEVVRGLPKQTKTEKISDRFNEVTITNSRTQGDPGYIAGVVREFVKAGYPVYLMEVG